MDVQQSKYDLEAINRRVKKLEARVEALESRVRAGSAQSGGINTHRFPHQMTHGS